MGFQEIFYTIVELLKIVENVSWKSKLINLQLYKDNHILHQGRAKNFPKQKNILQKWVDHHLSAVCKCTSYWQLRL